MFSHTVPGVVLNLTGQPKFTSIVLTWSTPQEPNGVIISYEVTYSFSDGNVVTANTTDLRFTIPSLTPDTNVTDISVSAYIIMGRGDPVQISHLVTVLPRKLRRFMVKLGFKVAVTFSETKTTILNSSFQRSFDQ